MPNVTAVDFIKERLAQARKALARLEKQLDAFEFSAEEPSWADATKLAHVSEKIVALAPEEKRGRPPGKPEAAPKKKRGRPPKAQAAATDAPKRKRGRPPKAKPAETTPTIDPATVSAAAAEITQATTDNV